MEADFKGSAPELVEYIAQQTEQRVAHIARRQTVAIIAEFFPNVDSTDLFQLFYLDCIKPLVRSSFKDGVTEHLGTVDPQSEVFAKFYLQCNAHASREFFTKFYDPTAGLLTGDFSRTFETIRHAYEEQRRDWCEPVRTWANNLANVDFQIWELCLNDYDSFAIKETLKIQDKPEDITMRILALQRDLVLTLIKRLQD